MGFAPGDIVVAIVSSEFFYRSLWLEHAFILEALMPMYTKLSTDKDSNSKLKILVLSGEFAANYSKAVEVQSITLDDKPIGFVFGSSISNPYFRIFCTGNFLQFKISRRSCEACGIRW